MQGSREFHTTAFLCQWRSSNVIALDDNYVAHIEILTTEDIIAVCTYAINASHTFYITIPYAHSRQLLTQAFP